jgi:ribosomal protein S18 acetylase RimI-like enzyme
MSDIPFFSFSPSRQNATIQIVFPQEIEAEIILRLLNETSAETDFLNFKPGEFGFNAHDIREWIRLGTQSPCVIIVARTSDQLNGVAIGYRPPRKTESRLEVGICVREACWRKGIGRALMDEMVCIGRYLNMKSLMVEVREDNKRALAFYQNYGFRISCRKAMSVEFRGAYFGSIQLEYLLPSSSETSSHTPLP